MILDYAWLILVFPLAGVLLNAFFGRRLGKRAVAWIACAAVGLAFLVALGILISVRGHEEGTTQKLFSWIAAGALRVDFSLLLDPLSALMATVVTGVSFLIHIYSAGYMADDQRYARYFTYLNLFVFAMLILVLASNYLVMYVGWEGVGLCSYLLIGFWFEKKSAADAGKKAFIVNRVGDFGFALGIMLLFATFGTLQFGEVFGKASQLLPGVATGVTLLLFLGAAGKSAQIPLYVWLPDAMEGPTPVSALIHAATMVTAGVYMVARNHALFEMAPATMTVVAIIGAATALMAATMALVENDIKRVLAYSTISQLGYMFMAVGVGAYASGMFHLTTHAFFKALLFLAAGSIMHALAGELNIQKMGGLRARLKTTYAVFLLGAAALAGIPLFSGFFSKDEILYRAFQWSPLLWLVGLITALLTAIYIFRALFLAFWGESRLDHHVAEHAHESPAVMTVPMILLAILAVVGGYIGLPRLSLLEGYLEPVFGAAEHAAEAGGLEWVLLAVSAVVALGGVALAYYLYVVNRKAPVAIGAFFPNLYTLFVRKWFVDEFYQKFIVRPLRAFGAWIANLFDPQIVDGAVNGLGWLAGQAGKGLNWTQTGLARDYAFSILIGAVLVVGYFLLR
jgi:NADH-quinone oxidoreductase subunit L